MRNLAWTMLLATAALRADVNFEDCQLAVPGTTLRNEARCARLPVPENPADPGGRVIELKLAVVPSRARPALPDPVVFLAGGPGQSATQSYPLLARAFRDVNAKRDILLVDQRGTGGSNALTCPWSEELLLADPASLDVAAMARECLAQLDGDPRYYTTALAVGDLERVREALGYETFNLVGVSYGTRVALEYLRRYSGHARSVVLDGVVPPRLALGQEHARNAQAALDAIFARCRNTAPCAERFGDPAEPLARLRQRLADGIVPVAMRDPTTGAPLRVPFGTEGLAGAIRLLSYQTETVALIPLLLHDARRSGDYSRLAAQALMTAGELSRSISRGMELSVICTEDEPVFDAGAVAEGTYMGTVLLDALERQCAVWPRGPAPDDLHEPVRADTPALLLSGETDPVTPPRYGEEVAAMLGDAWHVVAPGQGHGVLSRGCIPELLAGFIADPVPARVDAGCVADLGPAAFFTGFTGPEL